MSYKCTYNVTILEIARLVKRLTGSRSETVFRPLPPDDPVRRRPDISRAKALLGWQPVVGLEEGLGRTIEHFSAIMPARRQRGEQP